MSEKTHWEVKINMVLQEKLIATILLLYLLNNISFISSEIEVKHRDTTINRNLFNPLKVSSTKPHIVFILADDLGWNDVFWHNNEMHMPTLSELARNGVILEQYYTQPVCTPSRVSLNSGIYPFKIGFQRGVPSTCIPIGLPSNIPNLPGKLKELHYRTYLVGKWHLGFCKEEYTPLGKGYDHFYGYFTGEHDHWFTHVRSESRDLEETFTGFDLKNEKSKVADNGTYLELLLRNKAVEIIKQFTEGESLFLLYATHLVHNPYQVPQKFQDLFNDIENEDRRLLCAMVAWLDESVLSIVNALKERGMWDNTLFIFTSDNGASVKYAGDNSPLRGGKGYLYEGGTRVPAFVHGNVIEKTGYKNQRLMHVVDWFNTLMHFAGGPIDEKLDSLDMWPSLVKDQAATRQEIIYNIDTVLPCWNNEGECAAIRVGNYKLFVGDYDVSITPSMDNVKKIINDETVKLFNLKSDPSEEINIASEKFILVFDLLRKLKEYSTEVKTPRFNMDWISGSVEANPDNFEGEWSPGWC